MARVCTGAEKIPSINVSKRRLDVQFDNVEEAVPCVCRDVCGKPSERRYAIITMTESVITPR